MTRIADFNINLCKHRHNSSNVNSVVVNNLSSSSPDFNKPTTYPSTVVYDAPFPSVAPATIERSLPSDNSIELYKYLVKTFADILRTNNVKLLVNLIDRSGKIIISAVDLVKIIALLCNTQPGNVVIKYLSVEASCCSKLNNIRRIDSIKVDNLDLKITNNNIYNTVTDEYFISLDKVIIPIEYGD